MNQEKFNRTVLLVITISYSLAFLQGVVDSEGLDCLIAQEHKMFKVSAYSFGCKFGHLLDSNHEE